MDLLAAAWLGRLAPLEARLAAARDAESVALQAIRWQADPCGEPPSLDALRACRDAAWKAIACRHLARIAWLRFDRAGHRNAVEMHGALATSDVERAWGRAIRAWAELDTGARPADLAGLEATASSLGDAALVIESAALRAITALELGDLVVATREARRASRMARVEALPQQEYLANLCLARVRRHAGHPHLANRIGSALARVAPPCWTEWLAWERRLSGELEPLLEGRHAIDRCLDGVVSGDAPRLDTAPPLASARAEKDALLAALDPHIAMEAVPRVLREWAAGDTDEVPLGLHAVVVGVPNPHPEVAGHSWVYARAEGSRRFLHPGMGRVSSVPRVERTTRKHGRGEKAAAVLALAGPQGMRLRHFVPKVYGFGYSPQAHDGVLRVLVHRLRKSLGDRATLARDHETIALRVHQPLLIPDPRTASTLGEQILRMVAARPGATAKQAAKALSVPLRTVQAQLSQLVAEGSCDAEKEGRQLCYFVEDTTFAEPTIG